VNTITTMSPSCSTRRKRGFRQGIWAFNGISDMKKTPLALSVVLAFSAALLPLVATADDYFNPNAIEPQGDSAQSIDLSRFTHSGGQAPGIYRVDIYLNGNRVDTQNVTFVEENSHLLAQLSTAQLKKLGVKINAFPALQHLSATESVTDLGRYIPLANSQLDFAQQRLNISIPQAALDNKAREYVDPALWNQGMTALLLNYSYSGASTHYQSPSSDVTSSYLNLRSGVNLGAWRVRNYSTFSDNGIGDKHWNSIDTYVQRDIQRLKGQLIMGDNSTPNDVFDSVQFQGAQLASDDNMLPDSLKGFAPVIRGIAQSNAQVTISQNGYIIYQTYVPPGAFTISDLYPTSSSGDLDVTIKEADGSERSFVQPFSAVPVMQREGRLKYAVSAGKYRTQTQGAATPDFGQTTLIYGLPYDTTTYGGVLFSNNYHAMALGVGHGFGDFGSLSFDVTQANTTLRNQVNGGSESSYSGQSYRIQYAKDIETTDTSFTLASYRYSTSGYYDFQEANEVGSVTDDAWQQGYNQRSKIQLTLSQSFNDYGNIYLSGYQQNFWQLGGYQRSMTAGYDLSYGGISYNLSYTYSEAPEDDQHRDQQVAFSVQIPLGKLLPNSWATYNVTSDRAGNTSQQVGLSGTALADNNLSYSLQQSYANRGANASGNANGEYKGSAGDITAGYNYNGDSRQLNYGLQGGVVVDPYGITLSQPQGDTMALVRAPGADDIKVENNTGVYTDWRGYAVVPYVSTYRKNRIALDTQNLGNDVDIVTDSQTVIPTEGALVLANFDTHVGRRVIMTLTRQSKPIPFGATATLVQAKNHLDNSGIVGPNGEVYLSGMPAHGQLEVIWGRQTDEQCYASFTLPKQKTEKSQSHDFVSPVLTSNAVCQ